MVKRQIIVCDLCRCESDKISDEIFFTPFNLDKFKDLDICSNCTKKYTLEESILFLDKYFTNLDEINKRF